MNAEKITVLLIEDNPGDVRLIQEMLTPGESFSVNLKSADTLSKGLKILREDSIELILLDLGLPKSRGLETLNKTQNEVSDIPIVVLTGLDDEEIGIKTIQNGAHDYLIKGQIDSKLLVRSIRYAIERNRVEKQNKYLYSLLKSIRDINQVIVREPDLATTLQKACQILVDTQGYIDAYIALLDAESGTISPQVHTGDHRRKRWEITPEGKGNAPKCMEEAVEKEALRIIESTEEYCKDCDYCVHGFDHQSAVIPINYRDNLVGILNVCLEVEIEIDQQQMDLLQEVAGDLGFARSKLLLEKSLQKSEQKFRTLFNNAGDAIFFHDLEGNFLEVNQEACDRLGYHREEILQLDVASLDSPKYAVLVNERVEKLKKEGHIVFETEHVTKEGEAIPVELSARIVTYGNQKTILSIARDITERKRAETKLKESHQQLEKALEDTVKALASTLKQRDAYTAGHQKKVTQLAIAIAQKMGLPEERIEGLRVAGEIHDIGKINVPAEILSKPTELSDTEMDLVKAHAQIGYEILKDIDFPWPVADIVHQHHERLDGSGYPQGLGGEEIKLEAKILGVADVVEAMSAHRPYRPAKGIDQALEEIKGNKGVLYDPQVAEACVKVFEGGFEFEEE